MSHKIFEASDILNALDIFLELASDRELFGDSLREQIAARLPAELRQEVAAELRQEAEAQMRQEAEAQGLRESIRAVLEARSGAPQDDVLHALDTLDVGRLNQLLPICATGSLADVRERLGLG